MKDWLFENHTPGYGGVAWKIKQIIHSEKHAYQQLDIVDTVEWGGETSWF